MEENYEEYQIWCFTKHIFLYAYTRDSPIGFCRIVKWVNYKPTLGKIDFPISNVEQKIEQLYRQIYLLNNN